MIKKPLFAIVPLIALCIVIGCGGSGGSSTAGGTTTASSTGSTGTTSSTGSTSSTSSTGTQSFTVTTIPTTPQVTVAAPNVTFNVQLGFTDPNAKVSFTTMHLYNEGNQQALQPPGAYGVMQTASGTNIDGQEQSSLTAVYAANAANLIFGGYDDVQVTVWSSKLPNSQQTQLIDVPTGTDWVTLPQTINATCGSVAISSTTVKPGGTIQATAYITPGLSCTSAVFNVGGFTPGAVTINGTAATLPATYTFSQNAAPFQLMISIALPASTINTFPVSSTGGGDTGSWLFLSGSGFNGPWDAATPFFIHS